MTRQEIEENYEIVNGIIRSPGKFEGEALYIPYFWDCFLNGFADEDDSHIVFEVTDEDRSLFPEIPTNQKAITIFEREDGFVCEAGV